MSSEETKGKLEFLDAEIKRYSALVSALRGQIKTEGEKAPQEGTKKDAYVILLASLHQELSSVTRRYESLEECRLGLILNEICDEETPALPSGEKPAKVKEPKKNGVNVLSRDP